MPQWTAIKVGGGSGSGTSTYQIKRGTNYASSVASDIDTKFGNDPDFFSDFGCDRSGVTDDTTRANNALVSISASGKSGRIRIPSGCKLSVNHLTMQPNVTIVGDNRFSVINFIGTPASVTTGRIDINAVDNWGLESLFIQGNKLTPSTADYTQIVSSTNSYLSDTVTPGLPYGSSVRVRGGSKNGRIHNCWFNASNGYSILLDTYAGNISRIRITHTRFTNCRAWLFGTTGVGSGLAYGSWAGGIHYAGDGTNYALDDLIVQLCDFYQMSGHCFWGHADAYTLMHRNINFLQNYARTHALDMCEIGVTRDYNVVGNTSEFCGYYAATDDALGIPAWGPVTPAAFDHTGRCINGLVSDNTTLKCNGTSCDVDGGGSIVIAGNDFASSWASTDSDAQLSTCGPQDGSYPAGTNIAVGINMGNTFDDPYADTDVLIVDNQCDGHAAGAIKGYGLHEAKISGNRGDHPATKAAGSPPPQADPPIQMGPLVGTNKRNQNVEVSHNTYSWSPAANAPIVVEDPQYSAYLSTEKNLIFDNNSLGNANTYPSGKAGTSATTTGPLHLSSVTAQASAVSEYILQTEHDIADVGSVFPSFKIYKHVGMGAWTANYLWSVGVSIVDAANHIQTVVTAGWSGTSTPAFNHAGGNTTESTVFPHTPAVVWLDRGVLQNNLVAQFTDLTASFPSLTISGSGAIDNVRNFTGNSLALYGASLSAPGASHLAINSTGDFFLRSAVFNNNAGPLGGASYGRLTNSVAGVTAQGGIPTMSGSVNWQESGGGYVAGFENTQNVAGSNGLLVRTRDVTSGTRLLTLNSAGTDMLYATADGAWSARAYLLNGVSLITSVGDSFLRSVTIGQTTSYDLITNVPISGPSPTDSVGDPSTHGFGITWVNAATGYMWAVQNTNNVAHSNGLLVKIRDTTAASRALDINVNGTDIFVVKGDGSITGNFSFSNLILGSSSSFTSTPLTVKSPGAFNGVTNETASIFLLNCASLTTMDDLQLAPSARGSFNIMREAGVQIATICPAMSSPGEWEVDGLISRVVSYSTPFYGGGSVAGSFMALSQVTGGTVWAQNWLVRDWAGVPPNVGGVTYYASSLAGLELDMGVGHQNTTAAGIGVQITWDNSFSGTIPKSVGVQIHHVPPAYFQYAFATQNESAIWGLRLGDRPGFLNNLSQMIGFGAYNDVNTAITIQPRVAMYESSRGLLILANADSASSFASTISVAGIYPNSTPFATVDAGIFQAHYYYQQYGLNPLSHQFYDGAALAVLINSQGQGGFSSYIQRPNPWSNSFTYFAASAGSPVGVFSCILDQNGYIQMCNQTGVSGFLPPSWSTTPGATTNDNGARWVNMGQPFPVVDSLGSGRFFSLNIQPGYVASAFQTALYINGVATIDMSRNAGFAFCAADQTGGFLLGATKVIDQIPSGPGAGSPRLYNVYSVTASGPVTCAGVLAGVNGVQCGGVNIWDGSNQHNGLGDKFYSAQLVFQNAAGTCSVTLSYPSFGGTPPGQYPAGTYGGLTVRGGILTFF